MSTCEIETDSETDSETDNEIEIDALDTTWINEIENTIMYDEYQQFIKSYFHIT